MATLRKIAAIKNVGRFRSSAAPGNPQLAKHVMVLGANGFGKTTICAILRSLRDADPSYILGRRTLGAGAGAPEIELITDTGNRRFAAGTWDTACPEITIFDSTFVSENIHSGDVVELDQKRSLYRVIIGQQGVALADEDAQLAAASREKTREITAAAQALQVHLPPGVRLEQFLALAAAADIDAKIAEQTRTRDAVRESEQIRARASLTQFILPTLPERLEVVLKRTIEGIAEDAERLIAAHLAAHGMSDREPWLAEGVPFIANEKCPFCEQSVAGLPLVAAYRSLFGTAYRDFKDDIAALAAEVARDFGDLNLGHLETIAAENRGALEFWRRYCAFPADGLDPPQDLRAAVTALRDAVAGLLERKSRTPLDSVAFDPIFVQTRTRVTEMRAAVDAANAAIRAHNAIIAAKKAATAAGDIRVQEAELNRLLAVKKRHEPAVAAQCQVYLDLAAEKERLDRQRGEVRARLDAHTNQVVRPYERRINELLALFNADFEITETRHAYPGGIATSSYQLLINRVAVDLGDGNTGRHQPSFKNTLSAGDRTTLALAFFLANLERDPNRANRIVVFDDPFSSQDAFRRQQTVFEIKRAADASAQAIVLSHDPAFLRHVWTKAAADRVSLHLVDMREQGVKILPCDLDELCRGRAASEIDDLLTYFNSGAGRPRDMIKKMRIVLETYCRATYSGYFDAADMLGTIVQRIRDTGPAQHPAYPLLTDLEQINDYSREHHHGEDPADGVADYVDERELRGFVRRTLKLINALQA